MSIPKHKTKIPNGYRLLKSDEFPQKGDMYRRTGDRDWSTNYIDHTTEAGSHLWGTMFWIRAKPTYQNPDTHYVCLKDLPGVVNR